jgi:hypothetical protein
MSDAMSSDSMSPAQLSEQEAELLPARTVLSLLHPATAGAKGDPGTAGAHAKNSGFGLLGIIGWDGFAPRYSDGMTHSGVPAQPAP